VIGLFCAYHLHRAGVEVVLIDRERVGAGCSSGNGGWICPAIATPLPGPGLTMASLRSLLRSDSPLYISPSAFPRLARWLWAFRGHCNATSYRHGVAALARLGARTPDQYRRLAADGVEFEHDRRGMLLAFSDVVALEAEHQELTALRAYGVGPIEVLDKTGLERDQPGLAGDLTGGLIVHAEAHVRPESLCGSLAARLRSGGVEILERFAATGFGRDGDAVRAVTGPRGEVEADAFVLATGAEASVLTASLGTPLPVQAGKGYSITVQDPAVTLSRPVHISSAKMGFTPFVGAIRVLGTMEFSGINRRLDPRRVEALERAARRYLPGALEGKARADWVGMRPVTPDGLPVIGALPTCSNAFVATGHQMLGVTLAPSTGAAIAQLVLGGRAEVDLTPFSPARFRG